MASSTNHALVFGAAGLLGWATTNQLLKAYPSQDTFSRVTAVIHRTSSLDALQWPTPASGEPSKCHLVSGVDLRSHSQEQLTDQLTRGVPELASVTHVFYFVFQTVPEDHIKECQVNCNMLRQLATVLSSQCPNLKSFIYPGGTRGYGIYQPDIPFQIPLQETAADHLPEDYAKTVAYPWFRQILTEISAGQWSWTEICPDAVIGFTPNGSAFSLALHWAQYLSLYAHQNGIGGQALPPTHPVEIPFPGSTKAYHASFTPVSADRLGRIAIYAALHPDKCGNQVINVADDARPTSFAELWPAIAAWFSLKGVAPREDEQDISGGGHLKPGQFVTKHGHVFAENGLDKAGVSGVGSGRDQLDSVGWWLTFDRQMDISRLRNAGFEESQDLIRSWTDAFEQFRESGIIF